MTSGSRDFFPFFRIAKHNNHYAATDLGGAGGMYVDGRWHSKGNPVIYSAGSIALAALETLAHYDDAGLPIIRKLIEYRIPLDVLNKGVNVTLPVGWDELPTSLSAQKVGTEWLQSRAQLLLFVPSVLIPMETNAIINPLHPDISRITVVDRGIFKHDPRILPRVGKS